MPRPRKKTSSLSHQQRLARALHQACGCGYQEALRRVVEAARQRLLPPVLDQAGRAAALELLLAPDRPVGPPLRPIPTEHLQQRMLTAFRAAHWPVEADGAAECGQWTGWPGPVRSSLARTRGPLPRAIPEDPDDPGHNDLTQDPEWTFIAPRIMDLEPEAMVLTLPGSTPAVELVQQVSAAFAAARAAHIAKLSDRRACEVCADPYSADHLLTVTEAARPQVCPACAFSNELVDLHPLQLAADLDRLFYQDITLPAGWTAVAALLACAGGQAFLDRLRGDDGRRLAADHWADAGRLWIPLPPAARPAALAGFGPGASLAAVVEAVDRAHPQLTGQVRNLIGAELNAELEDGEDAYDPDDYFVARMWPAVVAYAVCLGTQAQERHRQRPPWHAVDRFAIDSLEDAFEQVGSDLSGADPGVYWTLTLGVKVVAGALGWPVRTTAAEGGWA
ncbi:hypothetical protein AB0D98_19275 [Streptomyces sp. NPDC047987]|uniref:hypothetical protein n=1 Tax=unclassified Streptomyces TaxID=2593676 RepID=UPI003432FF06